MYLSVQKLRRELLTLSVLRMGAEGHCLPGPQGGILPGFAASPQSTGHQGGWLVLGTRAAKARKWLSQGTGLGPCLTCHLWHQAPWAPQRGRLSPWPGCLCVLHNHICRKYKGPRSYLQPQDPGLILRPGEGPQPAPRCPLKQQLAEAVWRC